MDIVLLPSYYTLPSHKVNPLTPRNKTANPWWGRLQLVRASAFLLPQVEKTFGGMKCLGKMPYWLKSNLGVSWEDLLMKAHAGCGRERGLGVTGIEAGVTDIFSTMVNSVTRTG